MSDEGFTTGLHVGGETPTGAPRAAPDDAPLRFGDFEFDLRRDELRKDGRVIALRPKPRALLRYLLDHPGRLLGKDELIGALWGSVIVSDDSLVQCVGELRVALGDRAQRLIKTLPRRGYMLDTTIERLPTTRPPPLAGAPPPDAVRPAPAGRGLRLGGWLLAGLCVVLVGVAAAVWKIRQPVAFHIDEVLTDRLAVAVLPLVDAGPGDGPASMGTTLADDIGGQISMRQFMRVIGPGITARYDPAAPDIARIGRELKVRYVLGGRVIRDRDAVVVETRLTSVDTGEVARLNRSTFATAADALQSNIDERVASAFRVQSFEAENARVSQAGYVPDAADLALMGWRDLNRFRTRDDLLRARGRFEAALRVDPDSVVALQGLGSTYQIEIVNYYSAAPQGLLEPGMRALRRAIDLGPDRPENLLPWGSLLQLSGQTAQARAVYEKALEISPNYAFAHLFLARALIQQGHFAEARAHVARARGLSPSDTRLRYALYSVSAAADFAQGRDEDAYQTLQTWVAEFPDNGQPYAMLAAIEALRGADAEAAAHMARHRELLPNDSVAYLVFLNPSTDANFLAQRARLIEGLRKAGLPER